MPAQCQERATAGAGPWVHRRESRIRRSCNHRIQGAPVVDLLGDNEGFFTRSAKSDLKLPYYPRARTVACAGALMDTITYEAPLRPERAGDPGWRIMLTK